MGTENIEMIGFVIAVVLICVMKLSDMIKSKKETSLWKLKMIH